jgi:hypothetical protein
MNEEQVPVSLRVANMNEAQIESCTGELLNDRDRLLGILEKLCPTNLKFY